ncbi:MAG: flagellar basal-body rod protein FlgG [Planctomycetes bacterium]|nr:flagellar basal-body rod protein FlgG [Planctomycetota bacterium]
MTLRSLSIAATGGRALMSTIDSIANNLSNVNTIGYKRSRVNFADLFYQQVQKAGFGQLGQNQQPTGLFFGTGVRLVSTEKIFSQGNLKRTDRDLDIAVDGDGFFRIILPDGTVSFTRSGNFQRDAEGNLVTSGGYLLDPAIQIDQAVTRVTIDVTGRVQGFDPSQPDQLQELGQLELSRFPNPSGLEAIGDNLYRETLASGNRIDGQPGTEGFGVMRQGFIEESNVDVIEELTDLINAQRAFEINTSTIRASDEILQTVNNLRR